MKIKKRMFNIGSRVKGHTEKVLASIVQTSDVKEHRRFLHPLKGLLAHIGSLQFIERLSGFLGFFLIEVLIVKVLVDFGYTAIDLAKALHIPQRAPLFVLIASLSFLMIGRYKLFELKRIKPFNFKKFLFFFAANLVFFAFFFKLNVFMSKNIQMVLDNSLLFLSAWYASAIGLTLSLFIAFFDKDYIINLARNFKKPVLSSSAVSLLFLYTYPFLEKTWLIFSKLVAGASYQILNIFYPVTLTFMPDNAPNIAMSNFKATIASQCSGIEGISLFVFLFTLLLLIDWKFINKKKAVFLYVAGIVGTFILNILRITAIFIIGQAYSPKFAIGFFHSNAGWILFSLYFVVFEFLTYDWLRKNES